MDYALVKRILDAYGVRYQHPPHLQKGYRNRSYVVELADSRRLNLILYKTEAGMLERIQRIHRITAQLLTLPVRKSADARIMTLRSESMVRYASLYNYLPGETIPWEAYTKNHIKLVGMGMSTLHTSLAALGGDEHRVTDEYVQINRRMQRYFSRSTVNDAVQAKLRLSVDVEIFQHFNFILRLVSHLPNQQLLHMDFVRGNLLFAPATTTDRLVIDGLALSGIIDFEKAAYGHPAFDIARTLAFLLVDCKYKSPEKIEKYFLKSGYNKRGTSTFAHTIIRSNDHEYDLLYELTNLFLFYDFYKFLRHNPYESLSDNEHFVRTVDMLTTRHLIQLVN